MRLVWILITFCFTVASYAAENDVYDFSWLDGDKEVYVLQNRKYRKVDRLYLGIALAKDTSEPFINTYAAKIKAGYFFHESWGLELGGGFGFGSENRWAKGVQEQGTVPFYRKVVNNISAQLLWSPFYSKTNTFNKIIYIDWILGAGLSMVSDENNVRRFSLSPDFSSSTVEELVKESHIGLTWSAAARIYLSRSLSLELGFTGLHYQAETYTQNSTTSDFNGEKILFSKYEVSLGLNVSL